jgi:diguanylate cyclase (GGDEF)-like protein/PAS domain S-box-containing protein
MSAPLRLLILASAGDAELFEAELARGGYDVMWRRVGTRDEFLAAVRQTSWEAVLADHDPDREFSALDALAVLKERELDMPLLIVGTLGEETAIKALKAGVHNCIPKGAMGRLAPTLERELREAQIRRERRQAQRSLRDSEMRYRSLAETASDAILTTDETGTILFANRAAGRIFALPVAGLIGERLDTFLPGTEALAREAVEPPAEESSAAARELEGRRADGAGTPLEISLGCFVRDGRRLVTVIARDIRERRRVQDALRRSDEQVRTLVDSAPLILFEIDPKGIIRQAVGKGLEKLGLKPGEADGHSVFEMFADAPDGLALVRRALAGESFTATTRVRGVDFEVQFEALADDEGRPRGLVGVATDVTEQTQARLAWRASELRYRNLFDHNLAGVYRTALDGKILDCNESFARIFGYASREEALERPAWDFYLSPEERKASIERLRENRYLTNEELCLRRKDGSLVWVLENGTLVDGPDGELSVIEGTVIDISERKRAEEQVRHLAFHDALTALPNRLLFTDRLSLAVAQARRSNTRLAVMFLDLDRFKIINDSLGHSVGDELLRRVGERLEAAVREADTVARLGGDEFTILVPGLLYDDDAARVARKILEAVSEPFSIGGRELFVTTSIGVSLFPSDGEDAETLVRNADTAMYRAKEQGRDNYQLYAPAMNARAVERLLLESRLRPALNNGELTVHYQPVVDLRNGRIAGAEALLRWAHPDLGLVPPARFIPIAEMSGLIVPIGSWVLREACARAREWQREWPGLTVSVNLSSRQFQQADLVADVRRALKETGLDPGSLDLEITESSAMQNAEQSIATLSDLKELGVGISMDDFGTGYSSLAYLKRFPIDKIKVDQSFIRDIPDDSDDAAIVTAIIAMARSLQLVVVAEGVETEEQIDFLKQHGCDRMQGFVMSRAVPPAEFARIVAEFASLKAAGREDDLDRAVRRTV